MAKKKKKKSEQLSLRPAPHWRTVGSLLLLGAGVFLLLSQISFLFNWKTDQSALDFERQSEPVANMFGKVGAWLGDLFIFKGFGVATLLIGLMIIRTAWRWFSKRALLPVVQQWIWTLIAIFMISSGAGLMIPSVPLLGGVSGFEWAQLMMHYLGKAGSIVVWIVVLLVLMAYKFKWEPEHIQAHAKRFNPVKLSAKTLKRSKTGRHEESEGSGYEREVVEGIETEAPVLSSEAETPGTEILPDDGGQSESFLGDDVTNKSDDEVDIKVEVGKEEMIDANVSLVEKFGRFDPTLELSNYRFPGFDLLNDYPDTEIRSDTQEIVENKNKIVKTLRDFGIEITKIDVTVGPSVTLYEIVPQAGTRISKIRNLEDDIALSLSALGIRIIAPMPGRGTIGIEVPNKEPLLVPAKQVLRSRVYQESDMELPVALGKTINNSTYVFDLTKMPHLLMAGATGQGKSVGLNMILNSILYKKHPAEVKFVLIDPKKVEFALYNDIEKHFLAKLPDNAQAIINDVTKVKETLNSLTKEMDNRYKLLEKAKVRNIKEYNEKFANRELNPNNGHRYLPYIILVIDEYGDFIMTAGKEVEQPIARLAQMARAVGIHMIIATQRPSVNIITGIIKANFPARIAFRVTSKIDSRTILDQGGAEKLVGKGDMLITRGNDLVRIQCAFISTEEVKRVVEFIGNQQGYPEAYYLPEPDRDEGGFEDFDDEERDALFEEAARIIVMAQQGSASLLQRKLKIGYNRAGRLIDQMEKAGIVGPSQGSKPREVYINDMAHLEQLLNNERFE